MVLETIWFFLWGLLWAIFFITDGFDFGVGTLYPILGNWVEVAALRAIRQEGAAGAVHVSRIQKMIDDPWTNDELRGEARATLEAIR